MKRISHKRGKKSEMHQCFAGFCGGEKKKNLIGLVRCPVEEGEKGEGGQGTDASCSLSGEGEKWVGRLSLPKRIPEGGKKGETGQQC